MYIGVDPSCSRAEDTSYPIHKSSNTKSAYFLPFVCVGVLFLFSQANLLISASSLMVTVKTQQIRQRRRRAAERQSSSGEVDGEGDGEGEGSESAERRTSAHSKKEQ